MSHTYVALLPDERGERPHLRLGPEGRRDRGLLRPRLLGLTASSASVALVAEGALLLSDDHVRIELVVGAGMRLEIIEPTGTVAYRMGGGSATWDIDVTVGRDGTLVWHGQPLVVAEGADVRRRTTIDLAGDASLLMRETLVLGRAREAPGRLWARTQVRRDRTPILVEDLQLGPEQPIVGVLGPNRVVDTVLALEHPPPLWPPQLSGVERFRLAGGGTMWRGLATEAHQVSLTSTWRHLVTP